MRLFLAGLENGDGYKTIKDYGKDIQKPKYILTSYYYLHKMGEGKKGEYMSWCCENPEYFLLDSGAFTFMNSSKFKKEFNMTEFMKYVDAYIEFINKFDVKYFIEMDIDTVIGYQKVKEITKYIEDRTGKKSIPVFHNTTRTKEDLDEMISKYDYIAISGISGTRSRKVYDKLKRLVKYANSKGVRCHGLAYTGSEATKTIPFFSADSSSWSASIRFATITKFNPLTGKFIKLEKSKGRGRLKIEDRKRVVLNSIVEWTKYQAYLDTEE